MCLGKLIEDLSIGPNCRNAIYRVAKELNCRMGKHRSDDKNFLSYRKNSCIKNVRFTEYIVYIHDNIYLFQHRNSSCHIDS